MRPDLGLVVAVLVSALVSVAQGVGAPVKVRVRRETRAIAPT